jgi:CO/xanthine dehydrogenase Mo-binding subunit
MNKISNIEELRVVGTRPVRPDGVDKVTGRAQYSDDYRPAGMLYGRVLRSPHAHARILKIDTSKAEALKGVMSVITGADFPDIPNEEQFQGEGIVNYRDLSLNLMARGKALYEGMPVAAVSATSQIIADRAVELIEVEYEVLPFSIDVEDAIKPDAAVLHETMFTQGLEPRPETPSNVNKRLQYKLGDVEAGFAEADVIVEGTYRTRPVHQGYIEPHSAVANWNADGQSTIWASSQGAFMIRAYTARVLRIDVSSIRVTPAEIGGGFGAKTTLFLEPLALLLSRKAGRPVRLIMNREEVFRASGPTAAGTITVKIGAKKDGTIVAGDMYALVQAGAFPGAPMNGILMCPFAPYDIANINVVGLEVVSNRPKVAAYRAPGAPISSFAAESAIDDLARKLGMDPMELRLKNAARNGTKAAYGVTFRDIGCLETFQAAKDHPHYSAPLGPNQGRGVAVGFWFNVGGESSGAVNVNEDGTVSVISGNPDIGGSRASMAIIAAEVLGMPYEKCRPIVADTASLPYSFLTGGSRTTFAVGTCIKQAAEKVVADLKRRAALIWDVPPELVEWRGGEAVAVGSAAGRPNLTVKDIALKAARTGGPIGAEVSLNVGGAGPGFGAHICDVEVDPETGKVTVLRYTAVQDVGKAIHPSYVEGQIQGGAVQGIGWALNEEYIYDKHGRMENPGFLDYRVPVASDLPMIDAVMVEVPNPNAPFGLRGVGEVPIVPPLAAVANAVRAATGHRFTALPLSPPNILAGLSAQAAE